MNETQATTSLSVRRSTTSCAKSPASRAQRTHMANLLCQMLNGVTKMARYHNGTKAMANTDHLDGTSEIGLSSVPPRTNMAFRVIRIVPKTVSDVRMAKARRCPSNFKEQSEETSDLKLMALSMSREWAPTRNRRVSRSLDRTQNASKVPLLDNAQNLEEGPPI